MRLPHKEALPRFGESRSTEITASTKDNTAVLKLTQDVPQHYVEVSPESIICSAVGGEYMVEVSSDIEWEVTTPQWVTSSMTNGANDATLTLTISPIEGDMSDSRMGEVIIGKHDMASATVIIEQKVDPVLGIEVVPGNLYYACTGETKTIAVTTEDNWTATVGEEWITLNQNEGQGELIIRQEASPDPHFLEVSPLVFQFGKEGGEREIHVSCDDEWTFDLNCDWLSVSQQSGTGNAVVVLTAAPNTINELKMQDFIIKSGVLSEQLTASQAPGDDPIIASFEPDTLFVAFSGGVQTVHLASNATWQLQASSWITLVTSSGEGDATFDIIVDNNSEPNERIGFVRAIRNGQVLSTMVVVQEGKVDILETDITELYVRPEGGSYEIHVSANQAWSVNVDVVWIHCDPLSGFGNKTLTVTVDPLPSLRPRTGHVKISGEAGNSVSILVEQN